MTSASNGRSYHYDAVGNVTERHHNSVIEATFDYTSFDKPHTIAANGWRAEIAYGVNRSRYLRKDINDSTGERKITHYLGSVEYIYENGSTTAKRYLGNLVIHIENNSDSRQRWDFNFLLKDHIGSTHTIANRFGNDINRMSFNAWGQRRHAPSLNDINNYSIIPIGDVWTNNGLGIRSSIEQSTTRGFTGHEHFDQVGIIHMNGRIYDPTIGRFLQADPIIQDPYNTQSLNRYSYVMNNPLSFSDPTGYFRLKKGGYETLLKVAVSIAITVVTSGAASGLITSKAFAVVVAGGFASGAVLAGNLKGAIKGAIQAAATFGIGHGKGGKALFGKTGTAVSHAVVGGISAEIDGGKFGHGFISSILTSGADSAGLLDFKKTFFRIVANAIVAGTISEITGGKFANGAISAAFRVAFNDLLGSNVGNTGSNDGKTFDLSEGCFSGNEANCVALRETNQADMKIALSFIGQEYPYVLRQINDIEFVFDYSLDWMEDGDFDGTADTYLFGGGKVTLNPRYYDVSNLVDTLVHEIGHINLGYWNDLKLGIQDYRNDGEMGLLHTKVFLDGKMAGKDFYRNVLGEQ